MNVSSSRLKHVEVSVSPHLKKSKYLGLTKKNAILAFLQVADLPFAIQLQCYTEFLSLGLILRIIIGAKMVFGELNSC